MKRWRKIGIPFISVLCVLLLFLGFQRLVEPKYDGRDEMPLEGNFTAEYYQETTEHDVIMVGDCEVYENIDPMVLWKEYGITSYIRGNAQQLTWQSYYLLEDTLKREKPKAVIYNVQALVHAEPERETYNRMTLDGLKWSKTKWDAIRASMCEGEKMVDYIFPLLRYHSRILSLNRSDLKYYWRPKKVAHNGYYMRIDVLPASESDVADPSWLLGEDTEPEETDGAGETEEDGDLWEMMEEEEAVLEEDAEPGETDGTGETEEDGDLWEMMEEEEAVSEEDAEPESSNRSEGTESAGKGKDAGKTFGSDPMKYLDKMRELCEERGISLILMKAPSLSPIWYDSENQQVLDYAAKYHLPYINFYDLLKETDINYETDTYDGGLHMNRNGAGKLSRYLGKVLTDQYGIKDHRKDAGLAEIYRQKYQFYEEMIQAQQAELDRYGEIRSY